MKVVALVSSWQAARRVVSQNWGTGVQCRIAFCNDQNRTPRSFAIHAVLEGGRSFLRHPVRHVRAMSKVRFFPHSPNDRRTVAGLKAMKADIGLHGLGIIYRRPLLDAFGRGILNAHIGLLPAYRGRCVMEWALLEGAPTAISTFFMAEGIDDGSPIVRTERMLLPQGKNLTTTKGLMFNRDMEQYALAVRALAKGHLGTPNNEKLARRYYVMSALFTEIVSEVLSEGLHNSVQEPSP